MCCMGLLINIAVAEMIPFSLSEIIHDFNFLGCGVILGGVLIPGSEDKNLSLSTAKKMNFSCPPEIGSPFLYHLADLLMKWNH